MAQAMKAKTRLHLARKLARNIAAICDEWTAATGWDHPAADQIRDLAIDPDRFAADLQVPDAAAFVESERRPSQ